MAEVTLNLHVTGMTCGKCERLISEGVNEVLGVKKVKVDRPNEKVQIQLESNQLEDKKSQILTIINSIVNGKFKATIESGAE